MSNLSLGQWVLFQEEPIDKKVLSNTPVDLLDHGRGNWPNWFVSRVFGAATDSQPFFGCLVQKCDKTVCMWLLLCR